MKEIKRVPVFFKHSVVLVKAYESCRIVLFDEYYYDTCNLGSGKLEFAVYNELQ